MDNRLEDYVKLPDPNGERIHFDEHLCSTEWLPVQRMILKPIFY